MESAATPASGHESSRSKDGAASGGRLDREAEGTKRPSNPRRGEGSDAGQSAPPESSLEGDSGVPQSRTSEPHATLNSILSESAKQPDGGILQNIGSRFVEARKLNKPEAWRQFQADIMANLDSLVPGILPFKDAVAAAREIEEFIKGSSGQVGRSNEEIIAEFIRGDGDIASPPSTPPSAMEGLDIPDIVDDEALPTDAPNNPH
jgi:hypothetical protein